MGRYEKALHFVLQWEGGLSDHPADKGGRTAYGITQGTYDRYRHSKMLPEKDVCEISQIEIGNIYAHYWINSSAGAFHTPLYAVAFDTAVNFGLTGWRERFALAAGFPLSDLKNGKRVLTPDEEEDIAQRVVWARKAHRYLRAAKKAKPDQSVFLKGWLNRDEALEKFVRENA